MSTRSAIHAGVILGVMVPSLIGGARGCAQPGHVVKRPAVVTVLEGAHVPNVTPPQRLDIAMLPTGDPVARCADMGGTYNSYGPTCRGVDY